MSRASLHVLLVAAPVALGVVGCGLMVERARWLQSTACADAAEQGLMLAQGLAARPAAPVVPAAAPSPAATPAVADPGGANAAAEPELDARLGVKRLVIARGVRQREPVEPGSRFAQGEIERIYAFVELSNPEQVPAQVTVSFLPPAGDATGGVDLAVGAAPRWRTWAYTRLAREPGAWHAVVRDGRGRELARQSFEIVASPAKTSPPAESAPAVTAPAAAAEAATTRAVPRGTEAG